MHTYIQGWGPRLSNGETKAQKFSMFIIYSWAGRQVIALRWTRRWGYCLQMTMSVILANLSLWRGAVFRLQASVSWEREQWWTYSAHCQHLHLSLIWVRLCHVPGLKHWLCHVKQYTLTQDLASFSNKIHFLNLIHMNGFGQMKSVLPDN